MVAMAEYTELDYDFSQVESLDLDLPFLEAIQGLDELFINPENYFETLENLNPKAAFVPKLTDSVFEQPISHTMWTSNFWETPHKSFPR